MHNAIEAEMWIQYSERTGTVNEAMIRRWFKKLQAGDLSLKNEASRRPTTVLNDRRLKDTVEDYNPSTYYIVFPFHYSKSDISCDTT